MVHFTVYYGNNEAITFNAECSLGSLLCNMRERLMPPGASYPCFELLPLSFVLEQFRPPKVANSAAASATQHHDGGGDSPVVTGRGAPFTGTFPFMGVPTRPLETRADTFLGGPTSGSPTPSSAASASNGFAGLLNPTALSSLHESYVLLGCRSDPPAWQHSERGGQQNSKRGATVSIADGPPDSRRVPIEVFKRLGTADATTMEQRQTTLQHAQLIAALPLQGGNSATRAPTPPPSHLQTSADTPLILAQNAGIYAGDITVASWRKAFSQYLSTILDVPSSGSVMEERLTVTDSCVEVEETMKGSEEGKCGIKLPPAAAGAFMTPVPLVTGYDVLWCGLRGEHVRLQEALDERLFADVDTKRKRSKKN